MCATWRLCGLVSLPSGLQDEEAEASASSSGKWGQGSCSAAANSSPPAASCSRNTLSPFYLGALSLAVPSAWDLPPLAFFRDGTSLSSGPCSIASSTERTSLTTYLNNTPGYILYFLY